MSTTEANKKLKSLLEYKFILQKLNESFHLHEGQILLAKALFQDKKRIIMAQCGRNWGKSYGATYIAWRYALTFPGSAILIVGPERKQTKEIYWSSGRIQSGPKEFVDRELDSELRIVFKNGSYIFLDGSDNADALRGVKPNLVINEESQDHSKNFQVAVMRPNLAAKQATAVYIGTPPPMKCYYTEFREEMLLNIKDKDDDYFYMERPTADNPMISTEWLEKEKTRLYKNGDGSIWEREYMGKSVIGGEASIFPMLSKDKHVYDHDLIMAMIKHDKHHLQWYTGFDPGTTSCFGGLVMAHNPFSSQVFILDEIYEKDLRYMSTVPMWHRARAIEQELYEKGNFNRYCDEAAAWFRNEVFNQFNEQIFPTSKHIHSKANNVSLIKDMLNTENCVFISDRCKNLLFEMENYVKVTRRNKMGETIAEELPDFNDHLIDVLTYLVAASNFTLLEQVRPALNREDRFGRDRKDGPYIEPKVQDWTGTEYSISDYSYDA